MLMAYLATCANTLAVPLQIAADKLTKIAEENWSTATRSKAKFPAFKPSIVDQIYASELHGNQDTAPKLKRIMLLEISQYLENYLWPNFNEETASFQHVMSIILMVNEKFRENVSAWDGFSQREDALPGFFNRVVTLKAGRQLGQHEKVSYLMFAINAFQSLENSAVRARVLKLASLPLWHALSKGRLQVRVTPVAAVCLDSSCREGCLRLKIMRLYDLAWQQFQHRHLHALPLSVVVLCFGCSTGHCTCTWQCMAWQLLPGIICHLCRLLRNPVMHQWASISLSTSLPPLCPACKLAQCMSSLTTPR